jgi:16S rRNA (guanine527-N7)-methyltransferase
VARSTETPNRQALEALGLVEPAISRLDAYLRLLSVWNRKTNLTAARTPTAQLELLIRAVLPLESLLNPGALVDVGSGNGSPGLILGVLSPERSVTLLEPRTRRWAFLREAARAVGRPDIQVLRLRHDEFDGPRVPNVTVRALRLPAPELGRLLAPGGRILALGALPPTREGFQVWAQKIDGHGEIHILERGNVSRGTPGGD